MPFKYKSAKGREYILHSRPARGGSGKKIYFFAKDVRDGAENALPAGYEVKETKTGLPVLKKL